MKIQVILVGLIVLAGACKSEIDGKTAATVADPSPPTTAAQAADPEPEKPSEPGYSAFDLEKSKIEWTAGKVTKDHQGGFKTFTGKVTFTPAGSVHAFETEIDTASVWSDNEKLTGHLKKPDFFDVAKHPKSSFRTTTLVKGEGNAYTVTGLLNLHGVEKEITFPATIKTTGSEIEAAAEFTIKRFDFGIEYKGKANDLVRDEVLMKLTVVAPRPAET